MTTLETIESRIVQIQAAIEALQPDPPRRLRGDESAARFAGYQSRKAFRAWAKENGIKPSVDGGLNFWSRADINKARERGKR